MGMAAGERPMAFVGPYGSRATSGASWSERFEGRFKGGGPFRVGCTLAALLAVTLSSGCRTGGGSTLSWWPGTENRKLAASEGDADGDAVRKPSETYPPYPTTSTPNAYGIGDVVPASAESVAAGPDGATAPPVTYGKAPPAQVGPYQSYPSTGAPPATLSPPDVVQPQPGGVASVDPVMAGGDQVPGQGSAFTREPAASASIPTSDGQPAMRAPPANGSLVPMQPPTTAAVISPATPPAAGGDDERYAISTGSRFSSPGVAGTNPSAGGQGITSGPPATEYSPGGGSAQAPSVPSRPTPPSADAPAVPVPPGGRPDRMYRPGGTSTYRPAQAILDPATGNAPLTWSDGSPAPAAAVTTSQSAPRAILPAGYDGAAAGP